MSCSLAREFGYTQNDHVDIGEAVTAAHHLIILTRPFIKAYSFIRRIIWWQDPVSCLTVLLLLNVIGLVLPRACSIVAILLVISLLIFLGLLHRRYRLLVKILPNLDVPTVNMSKSEANNDQRERVQEFRLLIVITHSTLKTVSSWLRHFYAILKWDDVDCSLRYYAVLTVASLMLYILPLRFNIVLIVDVILIAHPLRTVLAHWKGQLAVASRNGDGHPQNAEAVASVNEDTISRVSDCITERCADSDGSDIEKAADDSNSSDLDEPDNISLRDQTGAVVDDGRSQVSQKSKGVVTRILEMKRNRQQNNEKCTNCDAVFTTILKRRHICTSCGNHFCSRCCSHKVPRSAFGATAPMAQTETVSVCLNCFNSLIGSNKQKVS